jgi:putative hydrolase of HD superfamily
MADRLTQIIEFLEIIEPFKMIERASYLSDHSRHETDSDHAWHMALFAVLLAREIETPINIGHALELILVHDLGEIGAGDTFAYSADSHDRELEQRAARELFDTLPEDLRLEMTQLWDEFTYGDSPEAQFARALDRLQALAQNTFSAGRTWQEHNVNERMSRELNKSTMDFDPVIRRAFEILFQRASDNDLWSKERP